MLVIPLPGIRGTAEVSAPVGRDGVEGVNLFWENGVWWMRGQKETRPKWGRYGARMGSFRSQAARVAAVPQPIVVCFGSRPDLSLGPGQQSRYKTVLESKPSNDW